MVAERVPEPSVALSRRAVLLSQLPYYDYKTARGLGFVTILDVARRFKTTTDSVSRQMRRETAPDPVAKTRVPGKANYRFLYVLSEIIDFIDSAECNVGWANRGSIPIRLVGTRVTTGGSRAYYQWRDPQRHSTAVALRRPPGETFIDVEQSRAEDSRAAMSRRAARAQSEESVDTGCQACDMEESA